MDTTDEGGGRVRGRALRAIGLLGVVALAFHVAHGQLGLGGHGLDGLTETWLYDAVIAGSAVSCLARGVLVRENRAAWLVLGAGLLFDAAGEIYSSLAFGATDDQPTPSPADALYLLYYPGAYAGLVLLARSRIRTPRPSTWLDGAIAASALAAAVAALAFDPIVRSASHGRPIEIATNLAYPVGDLILIIVVVGLFGLFGWRLGRMWVLLGLSLVAAAAADIGYLYESAQATYVNGGLLDSLWIASALLAGAAAWQPTPATRAIDLEGRRLLIIPSAFALTALAVLVYGGFHRASPVGLILAGVAVTLVFARGAWAFLENAALLEASRRDALSDALTGLGNRRAISAELEHRLTEPTPVPAVLAIFDLDGFKAYNDRFGHVAGDTLLALLGRRLEEAIGTAGTAYRLGGDEFCLVLDGTADGASPHLAAACAALSTDGDGFAVGASSGCVSLPTEAQTATQALRLADDRMYTQKGSRRGSARQQTRDVLLEVLRERGPALHAHVCEVARLAARVGRRMELPADQLDDLRRAAELHDVGKAAIPDAILAKAGPLDEQEADLVHRHTIIGERILVAAPALSEVARLVRSSHERWDGTGYPDRLAGDAIPLGARIIAVCDAFEAMTVGRPSSPAVLPHAALAELERCAGTHFDPAVVEVFATVWRERTTDEPARAA